MSGVVTPAYDPRTQKLEIGESQVWGQPGLHNGFKANLSYREILPQERDPKSAEGKETSQLQINVNSIKHLVSGCCYKQAKQLQTDVTLYHKNFLWREQAITTPDALLNR